MNDQQNQAEAAGGGSALTAELERCPFCGGSEKFQARLRKYEVPWGRPTWAVECENCGAHGGFDDTESGAREAWNMRPNA